MLSVLLCVYVMGTHVCVYVDTCRYMGVGAWLCWCDSLVLSVYVMVCTMVYVMVCVLVCLLMSSDSSLLCGIWCHDVYCDVRWCVFWDVRCR